MLHVVQTTKLHFTIMRTCYFSHTIDDESTQSLLCVDTRVSVLNVQIRCARRHIMNANDHII